VAEAMASGAPVVCTPNGTSAIARHEETALVIDSPASHELADALQRLRKDAALCRKLAERARATIADHSWDVYARQLLKVVQHDGYRHYTYAPNLGLYGKWSLEERLSGLQPLLERVRQLSVIDFGAAEGVIAREFLQRGARKVHGFDLDAGRVNMANMLCASWDDAEFRTADISDWVTFRNANSDLLDDSYDVVLYLGLHHHLPPESRGTPLAQAIRLARHYFAIRTSTEVYDSDNIDSLLRAEGFRLISSEHCHTHTEHLGLAKIYEKYRE
jgi:2-polyprenyl-3-methyl-5-hydroxy-6-metoxy-1,4-benzoquinol methylase